MSQTEAYIGRYPVDLISLMDHTPGARQFRNIETWRTYYGGKNGRSIQELDRLMASRRALFAVNYARHRGALVALAKAQGIVVASHDDATAEHVGESIADGVAIAEFPTTVEAAAASHAAGIAVLMGAPNVVRGGSHSGNVAAEMLAREGVLDILSSDYVPAALLMGAFDLARRRYAATVVIVVDAPVEVRAARLAARDRESPEEVRVRLERVVAGFHHAEADLIVDNGGAPEGAAALIVGRLLQTAAEAQRRLRHTPP